MSINSGSLYENSFENWDVRKDEMITFFDPTLSYEATGYRPIDGEHGLDFDPNWFNKVARNKKNTKKYCPYKPGTKEYRDFWTEQGWRCREGYTVNGYTITGDNYYFINFYQLKSLDVKKAGEGRQFVTPDFYVEQYKYFHYVELCRYYGYNGCTLKARGIGWSEINACMCANMYTWRQNTRCVIVSYADYYTQTTVKKVFDQLDWNNGNSEGGMRRLRQKKDSELFRRASRIEMIDGQEVETGQKSEIVGLVADKPRKVRGDRTDLLLMEESGSWPQFEKAYEQAKSLVTLQGKRVGNIFCFGTGGDEGANLAGLASVFNSPEESNILGYRHNHTKSGDYVITGFFVPAYTIVKDLMDNRGWTDPELGKSYFLKERNKLLAKPNKYLIYCAENCWTPDEALALEGDNRFNTNLLIEQKSRIVMFKETPEKYIPKYGELDVMFRNGNVDEDIVGIKFNEKLNGKTCIIEPPLIAENGLPYKNLYVAGIDGIDIGGNETSENTKHPSDFCIVIKKRIMGTNDPMYVAYYRDRPDNIYDAFRAAMKLIMWYNAKSMIEKTRVSFIKFMEQKKLKYRYMMRRPSASSSNDTRKSNEFGAPSTEAIIQHGLDLVSEFVEEYSHTIWIPEMIDELATYSYEQKRKFDMVAAMQMAELADEDLLGSISTDSNPVIKQQQQQQQYVYGYYTDERGYKRKGKIPLKNNNVVHHLIREEEPDMLYSPNGQDYTADYGSEWQ